MTGHWGIPYEPVAFTMFQLKNFVSIAASMLNYVRSTTGKVTDLQPGSVTRTILEAPAAEIEELYVQVFNGIKEAIPVAVYNSIKFDKLPPRYASGMVTILANTTPTAARVIPAGTTFLARDGRLYANITASTWPANQPSMSILVHSVQPGYSQNAAPNEINSSSSFPADQFTFTSSEMANGADNESDAERDIRFADYISALSRGTEAALLYGARSARLTDSNGNITESVTRASLVVGTGSVIVYIWGSSGQPSQALLARALQIESGYQDAQGNMIPGYAAAGISCTISPMVPQNVDILVMVTMLAGYTLTPTVESQIRDSITSAAAAVNQGEILYVEDVKNAAVAIEGVEVARVGMQGNIVCGQGNVLSAQVQVI